MKLKLGDIVVSKSNGTKGTIGIIVKDPKDDNKLVVRIHPYIYGQIVESDWELIK